jgi:S-DNA-T family DNA segregation ATPase FtsK/SpoIIIE
MILSILFQALPNEVKFIMIDPKMVELSFYHDIPHLLAPVITDTNYAVNSLKWTVAEMEKRYRIMAKLGCKNITTFNQKIDESKYKGEIINNPISLTPDNPEKLDKWPYIVVIIDELADLMISSGKKIEQYIVRIAQKARAVGIHLIVATQRPSVDVITGLIKANIPTRISFQVTSKVDSRTILDQGGAETLLGQGDMLYLQPGNGSPQRVHGAFVNDDEVNKIVNYLKQYAKADYIEEIISGEFEGNEISNIDETQDNNEKDSVFDEAVKFIYDSKRCSISSLQTRFGIGYNRAARIMAHLENVGMVKRNERGGFELMNKNIEA